jgi:hypothetical protein
MGTCASVPPKGAILSIHFTDYVATSEYKLYQKAHPPATSASAVSEPWTDMLQKLHLPYICRKQTLRLKRDGPTPLPASADLCVGLSVRNAEGTPVPYRVTAEGFVLLSQDTPTESSLFAATDGTYRSCLYYTPSAEESLAGLVVLTEALPLRALAHIPLTLSVISSADPLVASTEAASALSTPTVELLLVELPPPLSAALQKTRGRIHLRSKDWLYDPLTLPGFFPDLPF